MFRFLQRLWRNLVDESSGLARTDLPGLDAPTRRLLHRTIAGVRADMEGLRFNTAIAKLIELNNHLTRLGGCPRELAEPVVLLLAPLAPHAAEELWRLLGHAKTLAYEAFPEADPALLADDTVELPVQVNGRVRSRITVPSDADAATTQAVALADARVRAAIGAGEPKKVVVVAGRMVSIVV
jgi:leucyl-tRNA synthetase